MAQDDFQLLVGAVQRAESGNRRYGPDGRLLTSPKGAQGEMQVMPATQRSPGFGVEPARKGDPEDMARVGRDYLRAMVDRYGNREHALAAYNWGPGNVDKWLARGADPSKLPKETQDYIARVDRFMSGKPAAPASRPAAPEMDEATKGLVDATDKGLSAQAPTVSRETPPQLAQMGPSYQAALALSVLADVDEEERKDRDVDDDREPSIAQKWLMQQSSRPAALASLSDISIRSPFEPIRMASGGEVKPPLIMFSSGNTAAVDPVRAIEPISPDGGGGDGPGAGGGSSSSPGQGVSNAAAAAGLGMMGVPSPAAAMGITGPAATAVNAMSPVATAAAMGLNAAGAAVAGQQADAMGQAHAALDAMSSVPGISTVSDVNGNVIGISNDASIAAADAAMGLSAPADATAANSPDSPSSVGMGGNDGPGVGDAPGYNQGGEVEAPNVFKVPLYAETVAYEMYPGQGGQFDQRDAARHMLAAGTLARKYGPTAAEMLGKLHEITTSPMRYLGSKLGISEMPVDYEQDLHNNRVGIDLGRRSKSQKELEELVQRMAEQAQAQQSEGKPWIGRPQRPVKRAAGSPEEGEMAEASRPAFVYPKSGIGRRSSATSDELNRAAVQGISETPYNILGAPADIATMALRPFGYNVEKPVGTSDWIKQKAQELGIRQAPPTGGAAEALYKLTELGGSAVSPSAVVRGTAKAAQKTGEAAKMLAEQVPQELKNLPVGASVKPVEPFFQHTPTPEAPFVGRLDEFVSTLQSPVRKDQFLGQLKGKFREYDITRAENVLSDLPANAKLSPADLLNRLKERYDPANIRTTVLPPEENRYFFTMDNPYSNRPVGVIHMGSHVSPDQASRIEKLDKLDNAFSELRLIYSGSKPEVPALEVLRRDPAAAEQLDKITQARRDTIEHLRPITEASTIFQAFAHPSISADYYPLVKELQKTQGMPFLNALEAARAQVRQDAQAKLQSMFGFVPTSTKEVEQLVMAKYGDEWANQGLEKTRQVRQMADDFRKYATEQSDVLGLEQAYRGKSTHTSLNPPANAAGFSRFVEQTTRGPDGKPMKGIHLLEIQSDLTSELKAGRRPELKEKEVFPNMAENRRVVQQLGMKNAIAAAINRGDQFVTFPGAESAKPKLYESVRDNLKSVAKDLGPGFDVRPLTFTNAQNQTMQHWGIVWGPEAAQRIQKRGVPFKDGGLVDRNTDDHRKYL